MQILILVLLIILFVSSILNTLATKCWANYEHKNILPACTLGEDSKGIWVNVTETTDRRRKELFKHFLFNGPGEATFFQQLWVPQDCSYHRFTRESLFYFAEKMVKSNPKDFPQGFLQIVIFADSGTRGILCGITHLEGGSEILGPNLNELCGNKTRKAVSGGFTDKLFNHTVNPYFKISFAYTLAGIQHDFPLQATVLTELKPYAIIYNTGVGHFVDFHNKHQHQVQNPTCDTILSEKKADSLMGINPRLMKKLSDLANDISSKTRLIYRNIHYNSYYGALCFDQLLEDWIHEERKKNETFRWEIFDTRRISKYVWEDSNIDGFHFSREHHMWTYEEHLKHYQTSSGYNALNWGKLEMQLAQSLLNYLFNDIIVSEAKTSLKFPEKELEFEVDCSNKVFHLTILPRNQNETNV